MITVVFFVADFNELLCADARATEDKKEDLKGFTIVECDLR